MRAGAPGDMLCSLPLLTAFWREPNMDVSQIAFSLIHAVIALIAQPGLPPVNL